MYAVRVAFWRSPFGSETFGSSTFQSEVPEGFAETDCAGFASHGAPTPASRFSLHSVAFGSMSLGFLSQASVGSAVQQGFRQRRPTMHLELGRLRSFRQSFPLRSNYAHSLPQKTTTIETAPLAHRPTHPSWRNLLLILTKCGAAEPQKPEINPIKIPIIRSWTRRR